MLKTDCPTSWSKPHWRILCYHAIPDGFTDGFRAQLVAFREMGFTFIDFDSGLNLCRGEGFTKPMMTVTFDDGHRTIHTNALPILEELGIKGFLYLIADNVNKSRTHRDENSLQVVTLGNVRDWIRMGHGLGSHTLTHAPLHLCSDSRLMQECTLSKQILEDIFQVPIRHLSYPFGQHSTRTYEFLRRGSSYDSAATTDRGKMSRGHDLFRLRRDVCDPKMSVESIVRVMQLADRWYWLRHFRRYWRRHFSQRHRNWEKRHPEEKWEAIPELSK
jgi:peptidoglycan/xylan/chitin deacetylase (PgdA/CDA1 family)